MKVMKVRVGGRVRECPVIKENRHTVWVRCGGVHIKRKRRRDLIHPLYSEAF
jgi:hypothetical protein